MKKSRIAVVTGGTRGIGAAISIKLDQLGYNVLAIFAEDVEMAAKFEKNTNIAVKKCDVSNLEDCKDVYQFLEDSSDDEVSILVNNAGITRDAAFHKMEENDWRKVIDVNLIGAFNMTSRFWSDMRDSNFGRVINISSINAQAGCFGQTNYSASKAGLLGFTKSLALEGAAKGITTNAIAPGYFDTNMTMSMPDNTLAKVIEKIPTGRLGQPCDIASLVALLVSDAGSFINGETISINGAQYFK